MTVISLVGTLAGVHSRRVNCLLLLSDGTFLSGSDDRRIRRWSANGGARHGSFACVGTYIAETFVHSLVELPQKRFGCACASGRFHIWSFAHPCSTTKSAERSLVVHEGFGAMCAIKASRQLIDERVLYASTTRISLLQLWDEKTLPLATTAPHQSVTTMRLFEGDESNNPRFVTGGKEGSVIVWRWTGPKEIQIDRIFKVHSSSSLNTCVAMMSSTSALDAVVASTEDGLIECNSFSREQNPQRRWSALKRESCKVARVQKNKIITVGVHGTVQLLDLQQGRPISTTLKLDFCFCSVVVELRDNLVAIGELGGTIHICSLSDSLVTRCCKEIATKLTTKEIEALLLPEELVSLCLAYDKAINKPRT
eukprot:TRINITY_DN3564_c0_g1_i2.p1 TRINITY_DN3564_c0_g1~~TRINITY_DN3564_c0_g1_i2.p1  ORF type:complete len:367 (-),score=55.48 TRINITY_DN3564_c0_g1_i2:396-1496(-)